jgi:hypothetical protein
MLSKFSLILTQFDGLAHTETHSFGSARTFSEATINFEFTSGPATQGLGQMLTSLNSCDSTLP